MNLQIGQKVVCIDARPLGPETAKYMPVRLVQGEIYTIRSIQIEPHIDGYGVRLVEVENPTIIWDTGEEREWSYHPSRFRPLVEVKEEDDATTSV